MTYSSPPPPPIASFLDDIHVAPAQIAKSLTLWPIVRNEAITEPAGPNYVALDTALAKETVQLDEVDEEGDVTHVRVTNTGDVATLFLFGEEICGAKQNRVANASFMVDAQSETVVDVSCVEMGRWRRSGEAHFFGGHEVVSVALRRRMSDQVRSARSRGGRFSTDQGKLWEQIDRRIEYAHTASATHSYHDYCACRSNEVNALTGTFRPIACQVGFVACNDDSVIGVEAIGRSDVFRADFAELVHSYAIDAVDAGLVKQLDESDGLTGGPRFDGPEAFLAALAIAPASKRPSLGLGEDLRIEGGLVTGCALESHGLVHLSAFPADG